MAIVVPGMLLASLAVLAVAGGFGGLAALGQAFSGPPAPAAALTGGRGAVTARPLPARLVAALSPAFTTASSPNRAGAGSVPTSAVPPSASGPQASIGPPAPGAGIGGTPGGGRQPSSRPASPPRSQPQPTAVDKVVGAGTSVTSQLPGPAGSTGTGALKTAGAALDSIAPIKSP